MGSYNMPPGVSVNDIPGNRPEDLREEAWWDTFYERTKDIFDADEWDRLDADGRLTKIVEIARDMGYVDGRKDEQSEAALERYYTEAQGEDVE